MAIKHSRSRSPATMGSSSQGERIGDSLEDGMRYKDGFYMNLMLFASLLCIFLIMAGK
jgi:hypothetical protein